ncbi:MAG: hypothetical protein ACEY3D_06960 [Rickettsia sp.]
MLLRFLAHILILNLSCERSLLTPGNPYNLSLLYWRIVQYQDNFQLSA